jgi:hypothetical protein
MGLPWSRIMSFDLYINKTSMTSTRIISCETNHIDSERLAKISYFTKIILIVNILTCRCIHCLWWLILIVSSLRHWANRFGFHWNAFPCIIDKLSVFIQLACSPKSYSLIFKVCIKIWWNNRTQMAQWIKFENPIQLFTTITQWRRFVDDELPNPLCVSNQFSPIQSSSEGAHLLLKNVHTSEKIRSIFSSFQSHSS